MNKKNRINSIEIKANTVDEAIKQALKRLGVSKEKVKIEVLSEGDKGLFGMEGAKPALVRVIRMD